MEPLTGAVLAVAVAWGSILLAIVVPLDRWVSQRALRGLGATMLVVLGLGILGLPHAGSVALAALAAFVAAVLISHILRVPPRTRG